MKILIEEFKQTPITKQKLEIVERKGLGHPDYICDAIMNQISLALCKEYIKKFGMILHHNIDKALLAAGESKVKFNGGKILKPMKLIIGDRATYFFGKEKIDVDKIAIKEAKKWIKENLRFVNPNKHVKYQIELKQGSAALTGIFKRRTRILGANDTSAAVGYAPFTQTEKAVYKLERYINSKKFKKRFPESGEDLKVMASRINDNINFTIGLAFVDRFVKSENDYFRKKEEIKNEIKNFVLKNFSFSKISVDLNTLDKRGEKEAGVYLTVTGTSAESADSGQVGRGNRVNGVISLNRPASEEAAAGKNPVSHVGKIYNVLSFKIADEIYRRVSGLQEVYVWLLSQIGRPISDPAVIAVQVVLEKENSLSKIKKEVENVVSKELSSINRFCKDLAKGKYSLF
jgi:S-adenosylmethionine synthetase